MKNLFTLIAIAIASSGFAQPTMTSANDAAIGDEFVYEFVDSAGVSEGSSGAMQTWDFSNVVLLGMQRIHNYVDPATTPYQSSYPGSNIVQVTTDSAGNVYSYHTQSSSQTELNGIVSSILGSPADMHYTNSQIIRQFPGTYNSTHQDTYDGMAIVTIGPVSATAYRTGNYEYLIDGYGTLITPAGNFPNTLRMKISQVFTDSTVYTGAPIPTSVIYSFSTSYFYGSCDAGHKLYHFYIGYDTTIIQATTNIFTSVSYQNISTGLNENPSVKINTLAYPVPTNDFVTIKINEPVYGDMQFQLIDQRGSVVKNINVKTESRDFLEWRISLADVSSGIYTVLISDQDQRWVSRVMKE